MKPRFLKVPPRPSYYMQIHGISVKKMKKPVLIFIMAIILATFGAFTIVHAQGDDPSVVAENMLTALNASSSEVNAQFAAYTVNNTVPVNATDALSQADELYAQAQTAYESGDYNSTIDLATQALNMYGNASTLLTQAPVGEDEETQVEDTIQKLGGYDRALMRLDKLNKIASDLDSQGVNVSEAVELLNQAKVVLDNLGSAIDQGNLENMETMLDQANSLMGQATGLLMSNSGEKRLEKTEHFLNQTLLHVNQLETKLNRVMAKYNITAEDSDAIRQQFQALKESLYGIDVEKDDMKNVTRQLQHIVWDSHQVGKGDHMVEDFVAKFNGVSDTESLLNRYRERVGVLAQQGYNTSDVEDLLNQTEALLTNATASLDAGDKDTAGALIDEARGLLNQADHLIDAMERSMKHSGKFESEDKNHKVSSFDERVQELRMMINMYRIEIQSLNGTATNTTALEAELSDIEQSLNNAQTGDDLDSVQQQLEVFGVQLVGHGGLNQMGSEAGDHSGNQGKQGKGNDFEEPEPSVEPEIPEGTNSTG